MPPFLYTLLGLSMWMLRRTLLLTVDDPQGWWSRNDGKPLIFVIWHNRLLFTPLMASRAARRNRAILASHSRDGEYAARYLQFWGYRPIRGSTSKGGAQALRLLKREIAAGYSVGLTPDGPRGPRYQVQIGVIALSQMTGAPIIPVSLNADRRWQLRGWDQTQIPKPFSRVDLIIGQPIVVPVNSDERQRRSYSERLRDEMLRITRD